MVFLILIFILKVFHVYKLTSRCEQFLFNNLSKNELRHSCTVLGFLVFFFFQRDKCYCLQRNFTSEQNAVADQLCNITCPDDQDSCGGEGYFTVYKTGNNQYMNLILTLLMK